MNTINKLVWTEHHLGEGLQMWQAKAGSGFYKVMQLECKDDHWELLFDFKESPHFGASLYYETLEEAKSKAERDTPIKILRDAELRANKDGQPRSGETMVPLQKDAVLDLEEPAKKISENHAKYEVRIQGNLVYLVEGVDFEFIK